MEERSNRGCEKEEVSGGVEGNGEGEDRDEDKRTRREGGWIKKGPRVRREEADVRMQERR